MSDDRHLAEICISQNIRLTSSALSIPLAPPVPLDTANNGQITFEQIVHALFQPLVTPIDAPTFTDPTDGSVYFLPFDPIWHHPLGKELCIIDVDTRPFDEPNYLFNHEFSWQNAERLSVGMLNHYMYGNAHSDRTLISKVLTFKLKSTVTIINSYTTRLGRDRQTPAAQTFGLRFPRCATFFSLTESLS